MTESHSHAHHGTVPDSSALAASLDPVLHQSCAGRLGPIQWFKSTWQRGGAATGFAQWSLDSGRRIDVMVKLPVGPVEHRWATRLGAEDPGRWDTDDSRRRPTPRVLASGDALGGYDLAWIVMERLDGRPLSSHWDKDAAESLIHAAASLQQLAGAHPLTSPPPPPDWDKQLHRARDMVKESGIPEAQRWNEAIRKVQKHLSQATSRWSARPINAWCHGDLHPGNAMRRPPLRQPGVDPSAHHHPSGPCVLIDLALVHAGNWIEDAVYLERLYWGRPELLHGVQPVTTLARARRDLGLPVESDYAVLAGVRRALMAACVPCNLDREGHPKYVHAALEVLEKTAPHLTH